MRYLIVEDEEISRECVHVILTPYAECDMARNGKEAVDAFQRAHAEGRPYDLIVMDIMMPVLDGQQALVEIRRLEGALGMDWENRVLVVFLTALSDPMSVVDAYHDGDVNAYLVKPVDKKLLLSVIRKISQWDM